MLYLYLKFVRSFSSTLRATTSVTVEGAECGIRVMEERYVELRLNSAATQIPPLYYKFCY